MDKRPKSSNIKRHNNLYQAEENPDFSNVNYRILVENNPCRFVLFDTWLSPSECGIVCTADGSTGENYAKGEQK